MNFQYYETLEDKSEQNLLSLVEKILPKFTIEELKIYLEDIAKKSLTDKSKSKSKSIKGLIDIGDDYDTTADLTKLKHHQLETMYKYFISREANDKLAVKWRFYQFLKYIPEIVIANIKIKCTPEQEPYFDLIIENDTGDYIFVTCHEKLDLEQYNDGIIKLKDFIGVHKIIPKRVIFATNKSFRNIPINESIEFDDVTIEPELWVEWIEQNCPFNGEDLIILNNNELELAGFNFISIQDLLNYIYEFSENEQISIFRQPSYFSEIQNNYQNIELIWKGIMVK